MDYNKFSKKQKAEFVMGQLKKDFPSVVTPLLHRNSRELLIATILSPQTNDETTNKVTPLLFQKYDSWEKLSMANLEELQQMIRLVNYHKTKARSLIKTANIILNEFEGRVPNNLTDLTKLAGVGRKVGNVIIAEWFSRPKYQRGSPFLSKEEIDNLPEWEKEYVLPEGFVIDTHVLRVSKGLGLTKHTDPKKVELDLMKLFPREEWADMSLRLIFHGRTHAQAKNPKYNEHEIWREVYGNYLV